MKIFIKYMVSNRCKIVVREILDHLDILYHYVDLGEVEIHKNLSDYKKNLLQNELQKSGLELMDDKKAILVEKIKTTIITFVHQSHENIKVNFSEYLSEKLNYNYTYLANLFSEVLGVTIEHFIICHKVERIKELMVYDELSITEIAEKMNYSSVAHLSAQFKKVTGFSPSQFRMLKNRKLSPLEDIGVSFAKIN